MDTPTVTQHADKHADELDDHHQTAEISNAASDQANLEFEQNEDRENERPCEQQQCPTALPHVSKKNVRLDERQENREQAEFDDVRVPRDLDRLFCSQHAVSVYGLRSRRTVCNGGGKHVPENCSLALLLFVKLHTGVPGAIQTSKQHQDRSPGK